jgi:hypothetical protein
MDSCEIMKKINGILKEQLGNAVVVLNKNTLLLIHVENMLSVP